MNLRQVEIFCAVMRCRTTIAAAYELCISQPAISNAVKHLEAQIGMLLFERVGNRLVPTAEALALYHDAEPLHAMSQAISSKITDMRDMKRGHFRLLTTNALMRSMAAGALTEFLQNRDNVQVFCDVRRMEGVIESVESGFADLGLAISPPPRPGIVMQTIAEGDMVAIFPPGHALGRNSTVNAAQIADYALIGLENGGRIGRHVREHFDRVSLPYMPNIEVRHCVTACALVERGLGVSIVDPFSVDAQNGWNLEVRPFVPALSVSVSVMYLRDRQLSRLASRFIQLLQAGAARHSTGVAARLASGQ